MARSILSAKRNQNLKAELFRDKGPTILYIFVASCIPMHAPVMPANVPAKVGDRHDQDDGLAGPGGGEQKCQEETFFTAVFAVSS